MLTLHTNDFNSDGKQSTLHLATNFYIKINKRVDPKGRSQNKPIFSKNNIHLGYKQAKSTSELI